MKANLYASKSIEEIFKEFNSGINGLSENIASSRVAQQASFYKKKSKFHYAIKLLLKQFTNPLVLLLTVAVIFSVIVKESSDAIIIFFIIIATGLISFWQEFNAGNAIEKLKNIISIKYTILRNEKIQELTNDQVVPGDIILLNAGDILPADCRIIESNELHVNESSLTGESYPVEKSVCIMPQEASVKDSLNMLWQGTSIVSGTAKAIAVFTGAQTIFGQLVGSLSETHETSFEKGIRHFGFFILKITILLALFILTVNLYLKKDIIDSILFSLALAVGMAPELLPAIMTFAMSSGAKKMLQKKVIVKKLSSIFNFGEVTTLCTDKTGTITEGNVKLYDILDISGSSNEKLKLYAFLNSSLQQGFENPIDSAISQLPININEYKKLNELPYDFLRKRLSVAIHSKEENFIVTKGAFQNVMDVCSTFLNEKQEYASFNEIEKKRVFEKFTEFSKNGFRVLGLSYRKIESDKITKADEKDMCFMGFILLEDPLKSTSVESVKKLGQLNIRVKIITGDNKYAAMHVAKNLGIDDPLILTGSEIEKLSPEAFLVKVQETIIFSEIEPHQKERIIRSLQQSGETVAYIGDGINDVAAINAADIGISTNNAVDVAKDASDFVLLEKDLAVLADGVMEGRKSFANSMKYILITTGATFGNMLSVAGASLFLPFLPMLPKQILLTNLISDMPFMTIASDKVDDDQLKRPGKWDLKLIRKYMITFGLHSSIFDAATFYILFFVLKLSDIHFQSGWFMESTLTELIILFVIRTKVSILKSKPSALLLTFGLSAILITLLLPISPFASLLSLSIKNTVEFIAIIAIIITYFITAEFLKILFFRLQEKHKPVII